MSLKLANKNRTYEIDACGTKLEIISLTLGEKEELIHKIRNIGSEVGAFNRLIDAIAPAIKSIAGFEGVSPREILSQIEEIDSLEEIIRAILEHCSLSLGESKNLNSSSGQPTPDSVGNVE